MRAGLVLARSLLAVQGPLLRPLDGLSRCSCSAKLLDAGTACLPAAFEAPVVYPCLVLGLLHHGVGL